MTNFKVQAYRNSPQWIGTPWETVKSYPNQIIAEQHARDLRMHGTPARVIEERRIDIGYGRVTRLPSVVV